VDVLIRFTLKNYRSFRDAQELSLVASSAKEQSDSVIHVSGLEEGLLPIAAIYGPNASGKSNLFHALQFFVQAIEHSQRSWKPDAGVPASPFMLDNRDKEASEFQLDFVSNNSRFQYGFSHNSEQFLKEWLHSYPSGRKQVWFERDTDSAGQIKFGKHLLGENRAIETMTRKNSLFLSAAAQSNHEMILPLFAWLTSKIRFLSGSRSTISTDQAQKLAKLETKDRILRLLSEADLGIVGMTVEKEPIDEKFTEIIDDMLKRISLITNSTTPIQAPREVYKVIFQHRGKNNANIPLTNQNESAGTLAFLSLLGPALETIDSGGVLCVDELDASLHPMLALEVVRLFRNLKKNDMQVQLIFNTHDVNLLDSSLLRRDEVWFTEKDNEGGSHLYALSDFAPRKHENLKRGYLQGRYGAVPFLSPMSLDAPEE